MHLLVYHGRLSFFNISTCKRWDSTRPMQSSELDLSPGPKRRRKVEHNKPCRRITDRNYEEGLYTSKLILTYIKKTFYICALCILSDIHRRNDKKRKH